MVAEFFALFEEKALFAPGPAAGVSRRLEPEDARGVCTAHRTIDPKEASVARADVRARHHRHGGLPLPATEAGLAVMRR